MLRRLCLLALLPLAVHAADLPPLIPTLGKWEITTELSPEQRAAFKDMSPEVLARIKKNGANIDPKAGTLSASFCLNQATLNAWQEGQGLDKQAKCDAPRYSVSGNTLTTDIRCAEPEPSTVHSVINFNAARDAYTFENQITSASVKNAVRGKARRLGEC
ncbi:DUF3617 domain-containing protein [Chitiniphilus eburneus]|uniref:DUF3617 family protein n=1 Tax=Chitiniphilus eburneus TaxID=2571148 RepID=A0A4U0PDC6_9NEIS|nr:DUF3617 family protein [Chitiniphilus eburneus]TJZ65002.1 DUF3617 family protein [Chitiniphilus eburneus]